MSGNLNLDKTIVATQLHEILPTAIANEDALLPETVHCIMNPHLVHDLLRHQHHAPHPDEGLPVQTSLDAPTCLADLVAAHLIVLTLPIVRTPFAAHIIIAIVNQPQNTIGSPQHMALAPIYLAPHVTVRVLFDFAAAPGLIQIAPQPDQTSF